MHRLFACLTLALALLIGTIPATAAADPVDMQPAGSAPIPPGPAASWILADMDTGQILAGRNEDATSCRRRARCARAATGSCRT